MTTSFKARVDKGVLVPQQPVDLPEGSLLDVEISSMRGTDERPLERLARLLDQMPSDPDAPTDGAAQHDHYLYGTPKRDD